MRKLFDKINRCEDDLEDIAAFTASVLRNPYYDINHAEDQREKDMNTCNIVFMDYLKEKFTYLETLQIEIEKEKHRISQIERSFTLRNHVQKH